MHPYPTANRLVIFGLLKQQTFVREAISWQLMSQSRIRTQTYRGIQHNIAIDLTTRPDCTFLEYSELSPNKLAVLVLGFGELELSFYKTDF